MNPFTRGFNAIGGALLFRTGRVGYLTTTGRRTGRPRTVAVGFVRRADGTLLLGAGRPGAAWVLNLRTERHCRYRTTTSEGAYLAAEQTGEPGDATRAELTAGMGGAGQRFTFHEVFVLAPTVPGS